MTIRMIDWGAYIGYKGIIQIPWRQLIDYAGVRAFICKGCQEDVANGYSTQLNLAASRQAGIEINGCYYWHYPTGAPSYWLDVYSRSIDVEQPDFIAVDIEQWWGEGGIKVSPQQISDTGQALTEGLASRYPEKRVIVYSRQNFPIEFSPMMDQWLPRFNGGWVASWPDYGLKVYRMSWAEIAANKMRMAYDGSVIDLIADGWQPSIMKAWTEWKIWQYSSRILLPADVGAEFDHQYDWNLFNGSLAEMKAWIGKEEVVTMPGTYKTTVPHAQRARLVVLSSDDKSIDMAGVCAGTDAVVLRMAGQDGPSVPEHKEVYQDGAFPIQIERATVPAIGWVTLDANYPLWVRQFNLGGDPKLPPAFKDRKWFNNETLKVMLQNWLKTPFQDAEWKEGLKLNNDPALWHPIDAIWLFMSSTKTGPGADINGKWQLATLDDILKNLYPFMDGGFIPKVPVYLVCTSDFFARYAQDEDWLALSNRLTNGWLAGAGVFETSDQASYKAAMKAAGRTTTELFTEVPMATPFNTIAEIFDYRPQDSYKYSAAPYGFNPQFHIYSYNRFLAKGAFYAGAVVTPLMVGEWCDIPEEMKKSLEVTEAIPPDDPDDPPADPTLAAKVAALEARVAYLENHAPVIHATLEIAADPPIGPG